VLERGRRHMEVKKGYREKEKKTFNTVNVIGMRLYRKINEKKK
jgi:hypothetical protein